MDKKLLAACLECFLLTFAAMVEADRIQGSCPKYEYIPPFDKDEGDEVWYGVSAADKDEDFEDKPCYKITIKSLDISDFQLYTEYKTADGIVKSAMVGEERSGSGVFEFNRAENTMDRRGVHDFVYILDSDYKNYMVWMQCHDYGDKTHSHNATIFSRKRQISNDSLESAKEALNKAGFTESLNDITQNNC